MSQHFREETSNGVKVVTFTGIEVSPASKQDLYLLAEDQAHKRLLLDLSSIRYLSSYALGILSNFLKKVIAAGGHLRLCGLSADLLDEFRITHLDHVFEIYGSKQEALRDF